MLNVNFVKIGCLLICLTSIKTGLFAQSIKRQSLNTSGNTGYGNGFYLKQTTGQSGSTELVGDKQLTLRQGFQQPQIDLASLKICETCQLSILPNPLLIQSVLKIPLKTKTYSVWICDELGRVLYYEKDKSADSIALHSKDFPKDAVYFIRVLYDDGCNCVIKLIVTQ
jgi:hypothetical protein